MNPFWLLAIIPSYLLIGTVWSGIVTRALKGDSSLLPMTLLLWPLAFAIGMFIWLYCAIVGKDVSDAL